MRLEDRRYSSGLYINDEFFDKPNEENLFLTVFKPQAGTLFMRTKICCWWTSVPVCPFHADETEKVNTLINHIQAYLYQKREWNPKWENAFAPALCNRIDRNTGGIVIAAKNAEALRIINEKIRAHELEKFYLCITVGRPKRPEGRIERLFAEGRKEKGEVRFFHKPGSRRKNRRHALTGRWKARAGCLWWSAVC